MAFNDKYQKYVQNYDRHCINIAKATSLKLNESLKEKEERKRFLEDDYIRWFEYYFPNYAKVKSAKFHKKLANKIIKNKNIRLLAEIFRGGGKSVHIDMGIPLYLYYVLQDLHFMLLVGETSDKANKLLSGIQAQIQYNKRLNADYGEKYQRGDWSTGDFVTVDGVRFMAIGFGQNPRGAREGSERPDYIVVDDVDNRKHFKNERLMNESVDYITEDVWGCFDNMEGGTERFVYANNNTHKKSITNRLKLYFKTAIDKSKADNEKSVFYVLTVCAVKDLNSFEPEWPEKASSDYWRRKFRDTPYRSFMREFMHVHVEEGKVFKYEFLQWRPAQRLDKYDALVFYGDLSYKETACFKGLWLVGKKGRDFDIIHGFLRQASRPAIAKWLYDLYEDKKLERFPIKYRIEGLFAMDEFINDFDSEGDYRGYYIPVVADKRPKADKYERIESMSAFFERRNVFFNEDERNNYDQVELKDQLLAFEKGTEAAIDGPDALEGALAECNRTAVVEKFEPRVTPVSVLRQQSKNRY
jgi:hypothetical protein